MCEGVCDYANALANESPHKLPAFHFNCAPATPLFTYIGLMVSHEHGKIGEVAAGAGGVCVVSIQQPAALGRPLARHGALGVVPEGAIWRVIILQLQKNKDRDEGKCRCKFMCQD